MGAFGNPNWKTGVTLGLVSTLFTALGLVLQKYSHISNERAGKGIAYFKQPWWLVGLLVFLVGQLLNLIAMALAPQAMLSAIGALSLVFNTVFARCILSERLPRGGTVFMASMLLGVLLVVANTPRAQSTESGEREAAHHVVQNSILEIDFLSFFVLISLVLILLYFLVKYRFESALPFFWALASAAGASYSVTLFKCESLLVSQAFGWWRRSDFYVVGCIAISISVLQVHLLNKGLKHGEAVTVVPAFFACGLLLQLLQAQLAYEELDALSGLRPVLGFLLGVGLVLGGTVGILLADVFADEVDEEIQPADAFTPLASRSPPRTPGSSRKALKHLDSMEFRASFDGEDRVYTVSLAGPMGIA
eukprot:TRINITY_DN89320_c0_g1_i1.p1 TRINITY_DN89320_c0_g1~~TRINITY_DN89320_c0_g1_i1.p1  ORF type:complete len:363 (-),score=62.92 TRINITY_DN89320_c0_g1_i1:19-1107(-)